MTASKNVTRVTNQLFATKVKLRLVSRYLVKMNMTVPTMGTNIRSKRFRLRYKK